MIVRLRWFALAMGALVLVLGVQRAQSAPTELFISEYIEGSGQNKALEIYNGTGAAVDLGALGYSVFFSFNGGTSTRHDPAGGHRRERRRLRHCTGDGGPGDSGAGRPDGHLDQLVQR